MYSKYLISFLVLIVFFTSCREEQKDYFFEYDKKYNSISIYAKDDARIAYLKFNDNGSIEEIHIEDKNGFKLMIGTDTSSKFYSIIDQNVAYNNLSKINIGEEILIERQEQFNEYSTKYKLFDNGQAEIKFWDHQKTSWMSYLEQVE